MAQKEQRTPGKGSLPNADPAELAEMGKKQFDAMMDVQKELTKALEEANRQWAARIKAETEFAAEFASKLTAARSVPETTTICQEWMNRRMAMFAEDSQRFVADIQKLTTRLLPKGWTGGST